MVVLNITEFEKYKILGDMGDIYISAKKQEARNVYCDLYKNLNCASMVYFTNTLDIGNTKDYMTDIVNYDASECSSPLKIGELVRCHIFDENRIPIIKYGIVKESAQSKFGGGLIEEFVF